MDLRSGILSTARALGMNPLDLASIMSYETAGTFDPTKRGPTTQYGQHEGLIQFGQPQAARYGYDRANPLSSQLGPDGAVAKYFTANGWKPGMGLMDAYSIVNAGGPGRYNASDANNGGAPGTVADKVRQQFGPHIQKAEAFLGSYAAPGQISAQFDPTAGQGTGAAPMPSMQLLPDSGTGLGGLASMFEPQQSPVVNYRAQAAQQAEAEQKRKEALFGGPLIG